MLSITDFGEADVIALDTETNAKKGKHVRMELFSVAERSGKTIKKAAFEEKDFNALWERIKDKRIVFHNAKYDLQVLLARKIDILKIRFEDTMIAAHLLNETERKGLKELRVSVLGKPERDKWKDVDKNDKSAYLKYAEEDALDTLELWELFEKQLEAEDLMTAYELEKQVILPIIDMEYYGAMIDMDLLKAQDTRLTTKINEIYYDITTAVGKDINLKSSKQLQELFFKDLKYKPKDSWKNKTGYSVNEEVLSEIARSSGRAGDFANMMLVHRKYAKLQSAFTQGLLDREVEGYVFPSFNATGAATGRFSCSDPNLQQIPRDPFDNMRDAGGQYITDSDGDYIPDKMTHIRSLFVCKPGNVLITADYSQIELRMMAELSQDYNMCNLFKEGVDIHQRTADITGCSRQHAKTLNFGIGYGMGAPAFAASTGLPFPVAQQYIEQFWEEYSGLAHFMEQVCNGVKTCGYVRTISGRKRRFFGKFDDGVMRQAMNTVIQGSAADLMKAAMTKVYNNIDHARARDVMVVHDELTLESTLEYAEDAKEILKYCMETVISCSIPLVAEPHIGYRWSDNK